MLASAQLMTNERGEVYTEDPFFNETFIKENKIREIRGRYTVKNPGVPMREMNEYHVFEFDTLGRLMRIYETRKSDGSADTMYHKYFYNGKGHMIYHSYGSKSKWRYWTYLYDAKGRMVSYDIFRQFLEYDGNIKSLKEKTQTYNYANEGSDSVRITNNSYGLPYKKEKIILDEGGRVMTLDDRFITTKQGWVDHFVYDENGRLIETTHKSTREDDVKLRETFDYDENGNIKEKKVFRYGHQIEEYQFIFNSKTQLCSAILTRDPNSDKITILRFQSYEYY
jgi:hypothetical protein